MKKFLLNRFTNLVAMSVVLSMAAFARPPGEENNLGCEGKLNKAIAAMKEMESYAKDLGDASRELLNAIEETKNESSGLEERVCKISAAADTLSQQIEAEEVQEDHTHRLAKLVRELEESEDEVVQYLKTNFSKSQLQEILEELE